MELGAYLSDRGIDVEAFAQRIKVTPASVYRYINKQRRPHADAMARIVCATDGAVQPNDFFQIAEGSNA